ncbi:hypothetical protein [Thermoanaerobacterium sp. DL9XJH110]
MAGWMKASVPVPIRVVITRLFGKVENPLLGFLVLGFLRHL